MNTGIIGHHLDDLQSAIIAFNVWHRYLNGKLFAFGFAGCFNVVEKNTRKVIKIGSATTIFNRVHALTV